MDKHLRDWKAVGIGLFILFFLKGLPLIQRSVELDSSYFSQIDNSNSSNSIQSPSSSSTTKSNHHQPLTEKRIASSDSKENQPASVTSDKQRDNGKLQPSKITEALDLPIAQSSPLLSNSSDTPPLEVGDNTDARNFRGIEEQQRTNLSTSPVAEVQNQLQTRLIEPPVNNTENTSVLQETGADVSTDTSIVVPNLIPSYSGNYSHDQVNSPNSEQTLPNSERCDYSWQLDVAGNRCGGRAASERPNTRAFPSNASDSLYNQNTKLHSEQPLPSLTNFDDSSGARSSGRCDYPWQLDVAGNRCGGRAASERPNSIPFNTTGYDFNPGLSPNSVYVRGYVRGDGTYVRPHYRRR